MTFAKFFLVLLIAFFESTKAMSEDAGKLIVGSFLLTWPESMEYRYGSKVISFDGGARFRYETGDTLNSDTETGVGVFELSLRNSEILEMKRASNLLCGEEVTEGGFQGASAQPGYSVACLKDGKIIKKSGAQSMISGEGRDEFYKIINEFEGRARQYGVKLAKLDFSTDEVKYESGHFIVSVRFINSGNSLIKFKTPDRWSGTDAGERLGVGSRVKIEGDGRRETLEDGWSFALGGKPMLNRDDFPDGVVTLSPGKSAIFRFRTDQKYRVSKGEYEFTGVAFMDAECGHPSSALSGKLYFNPIKTRITIDRDYPSTPREREEWEAGHRAAMSAWPVTPGAAFPEDGLYRAVRAGSGARSLQVQPFKAGDVATTDNVRLLSESASGNYLDGRMQWIWEASPPLRSPRDPFKYAEGTEHVCKAGAMCPRSGRWVARSMTHDWQYNHDLTQIVTVQQGQSMPVIRGDPEYGEWEWVGV